MAGPRSLGEIRRVVSGETPEGRSCVMLDGSPVRVEGRVASLWATEYGVTTTPGGGGPDTQREALRRADAGLHTAVSDGAAAERGHRANDGRVRAHAVAE